MNIPEKVINRLTLYHFIFDNLNENEQYISSAKIAQLLNLDDSQVRKDLKYLDNPGKCRVGYDARKLRIAIEEKLGRVVLREASGLFCPYSNVGKMLENWKFDKRY